MADIEHVVVLMLENRSFDHLLGYVPHPDRAFDGLLSGTHRNPGWGRGPAVAASPTAKKVLPVGPDHSHDAVMRALLYRKAAAFDFTMLGPRVPAVVISPRIRAGAVDAEPRDHASIPATLRTLFAPDAEPLTARDRWSPPFHGLVTLPEPRTGLLSLSEYATGLTTAIAAPAAAVPPAPATLAGTPAVPGYYQSFLALAGQVQEHLAAVGEPEVAEITPGPAALRGTQVTRAFAAAAERHRESR